MSTEYTLQNLKNAVSQNILLCLITFLTNQLLTRELYFIKLSRNMTKKEYNEEEILFPYKTLKYTKHHFIPTSVVILTLKSSQEKILCDSFKPNQDTYSVSFSTLLLIHHCILLVFITASQCLFDRFELIIKRISIN